MIVAQALGVLFIIVLIGAIVSWKEMRYAFRANFALSNKSLVLLSPDLFREAWYPFLNMYCPYFQNLDAPGKEKFRTRLIQNLRDLEILGKEGMEVNDEMRILLCASLTQLTYGLKRQGLRGYKLIHVYSSSFYANQYNDFTESVTYSNNLIALSWIHYERGILNNEDGSNIGLTEFAYALLQTVKNGERFELSFGSYVDTWIALVNNTPLKEEFLRFINIAPSENDADHVFPHAVALFFEKPYEFKQKFTAIYAHLCLLLNQNPLNTTGNYVYDSGTFNKVRIIPQLPKKITPQYTYHTWHWSYNLFIITPFIFPFIAVYFICYYHIINFPELALFLLITGIILTALTYKLNKKHVLFGSALKLALFNTFGSGPVLFSAFVALNDTIDWGAPIQEEHAISEVTMIYEHTKRHRNSYITDFEFSFTDNFWSEYPITRRIDAVETENSTFNNATVNFVVNRGLFGLKHISDKQVLYHTSTPPQY